MSDLTNNIETTISNTEGNTVNTPESTPNTTTDNIPTVIQSTPPTAPTSSKKTCIICGKEILSTRRRKLCGREECKKAYMATHHKKWLDSGNNRKNYNAYMKRYVQKMRDKKKAEEIAPPTTEVVSVNLELPTNT